MNRGTQTLCLECVKGEESGRRGFGAICLGSNFPIENYGQSQAEPAAAASQLASFPHPWFTILSPVMELP